MCNKYFLERLLFPLYTYKADYAIYNTYQFNNYDNYVMEIFSEEERAAYCESQLPLDLQTAYDNGKKTVEALLSKN